MSIANKYFFFNSQSLSYGSRTFFVVSLNINSDENMPGPGFLVVIVALLAGFLTGAIFGLLVGVAKAFFGANEVITTVMLNYVAALIVQWATAGPIQAPNTTAAETILFDQKFWLPKVIAGTNFNIGIFILIVCLIFFGIFLFKTKPGFAMRIVGQNKKAAAYSGISVNRNILMSMFIAGGFAGLGGAVEVLGVQHRLLKGMSSNYGFDGIAVSLLGGNLPVGMDWDAVDKHARYLIEHYDIKTTDFNNDINTLSGGNQQKLVVARELDKNPKLLLAVHPTRGVDIGATEFIHDSIVAARDKGCAVLLISTELDEIMKTLLFFKISVS